MDEEILLEEIEQILTNLLRPLFRGPVRFSDTPTFRRGLNGEQVEEILQTLYGLVRKIKERKAAA